MISKTASIPVNPEGSLASSFKSGPGLKEAGGKQNVRVNLLQCSSIPIPNDLNKKALYELI